MALPGSDHPLQSSVPVCVNEFPAPLKLALQAERLGISPGASALYVQGIGSFVPQRSCTVPSLRRLEYAEKRSPLDHWIIQLLQTWSPFQLSLTDAVLVGVHVALMSSTEEESGGFTSGWR